MSLPMEMLEVYRRDELLGRYTLGRRNLELGTAAECDVVIQDPELAARHWLLMRCHGSVFAFDVSRGRLDAGRGRPLALDASFTLGREHSIKRVYLGGAAAAVAAADAASTRARQRETITENLAHRTQLGAKLVLTVGSARDARRIPLGGGASPRILQIGRAAGCDIQLSDRAVSERHARIEPAQAALWVRDLGSRNGTYVDGVPIQTACLAHGSILRVGRTDLRVVAAELSEDLGAVRMVAASSNMLQVLAEVQRMAALPWPVLVTGESGTGKEGIALSLHRFGPRSQGPFVAVNAGGLPRELIESELFGHERGAFTGAAASHRGVFEQAAGGTLFLDEIAELPLELQARLLRVLETGEIRRVGAERTFEVDVRLVCATHRDLRAMLAEGSFRRDLYYRIARLAVEVPALRTRPEDVSALARHFLQQIASDVGRRELSPEALTRLFGYDWPGNARELRNVLGFAAASSGPTIEAADIERALARLGDIERRDQPAVEACRLAVEQYGGNKAAAARALGIPRSTLRDRLRT